MSLNKGLKYFLIAVIYLQQLNSFSQDKTIDSLKLALKNAKHDTIRCTVLLILAETASDEEWVKYNEELLKLAENKLKTTGLRASEQKLYQKYLADGLNNVGYLAKEQGDIPKALLNYGKSLKIREELGYKKGIAESLNNIGFIYQTQGDISQALEYYGKSLKIQEDIGDKHGCAISLNNIGLIYNTLGDFQKALAQFSKSLKLREEIGDEEGIANSSTNIGYIYQCQGDYAIAMDYYGKSLKILEKSGDKNGIAWTLGNVGVIYKNLGDYTRALECYTKCLKIQEEIRDKEGIALSLNNMGIIYFKQKIYSKALEFCSNSMKVSKELGFPKSIKDAAISLNKIHKAAGNYRQAFENYGLYIQMSDSVNNIETQKAAVRKQLQYVFEKKEAIAKKEYEKELEKQQAIADEKQRKQNIVIWSVVLGLILVIGFAVYVFKTLSVTRNQKLLIEIKSREVEEKQKEILDSIYYARRIQQAQIPSDKYIHKNLIRLRKKG